MTEPKAGDQLDHYRLDRLVARSGMATLFDAHDLATGRHVAIKIPHPEVESDPGLFERFKREEQIGITMEHPGVVKVFADDERSSIYMVMEWVDGRLLRQILDEPTRMPAERAIHLAEAIAEALEYIHSHGVVHRDLKPENIMVSPDDRIKLIDFGIAANAGARRLTFANFSPMLGTPDYIAPEQVKGKRGDARTDLYALGVMLYEMLTGKVPFSGPNALAVMNDRLLNDPVLPRTANPDLSPAMQEILLRALERDPRNRYHSAREFAHDLRHPEEIVVGTHTEVAKGVKRKTATGRNILMYCGLGAIPLVIFLLLLYTARHH
jgi:serine/threonine protein kinase